MPIKFNCHKCGANLRVPEQHIGKKARCPKCDEKCVVPEASQRGTEATSGTFEEVGDMLPPTMPEAVPVAAPVAQAMPLPAASPVALPSSIPMAPPSSPYASPTAKGHSGISAGVVQPLYEARNMIRIFGWAMVIMGALYCITIVYAIIGWLPLWMGWQLKGAAEALTAGVESGNQSQVQLACERLATYFKIMGVLTIIWLVLLALGLVFVVVMLIIGVGANI